MHEISRQLFKIAKLIYISQKQSKKDDRILREIGMLDKPWREIFFRWLNGRGDWNNAPFGDYLMKNQSLQREMKNKLDSITETFLHSNKNKQKIKTSFHMELDDNGYTTGYELLHGTTKYKDVSNHEQDFELNLELKKQIINKKTVIIGKAHCVWHDMIDANRQYLGEGELADAIKKFSKAKDYKISIPFDFYFEWKQDDNNGWKKQGYPWK